MIAVIAALAIFAASEMMPSMSWPSQLPASLPLGILKSVAPEETAMDGSIWLETIRTIAVIGEHLHLEKSLILNTCRQLRMGRGGFQSRRRG